VCASSYRTLRIAPGVARELSKHVAILEREIAELASNDAGVNFATHRNVRCRETGEERKLPTPQPVWDAAVRPQSDDRRTCIMRDSNEKPPPPKRPFGKLLCSPRREAKATAAYFRKAFSHRQPAPTGALTPAEIEARKRRAKEYFRRAFAHLRPKANG
jgi:hypothetical protein